MVLNLLTHVFGTGTRLEEQNKDRSSTHLIFDIEESFGDQLEDVSEEETNTGQLLLLQLMIDNQGEDMRRSDTFHYYF